jgi:hypothetical protein
VRSATVSVTFVACIQAGLAKYCWYQRVEKDGGGKVRKRALEKEIGAMIRTGRIR